MRKSVIYLFLVVLFTISCALPSFSSKQAPKELQYVFEENPEPISVLPTLEEAIISEKVIGPEGGEISVSSSAGTSFTLAIPPDALVAETLIKMIPVSEVEGMPFGSAEYAVQLLPEGLSFLKYATLTIDPVEEIPIDQQIFFDYQGLGEDLALAIPVVDSDEMKILVDHFSGHGVSKGLLADIEPVRERIGGAAERRIQSAVAEKTMIIRQRLLMGETDGEELDLGGLFEQYDREVVQPRLAAAGDSCAAGRLALITVIGVKRQQILLGVKEEDGAGSSFDYELMEKVAGVCMKEEYELCRDEHIVHRIIPAYFGIERQGQLLGIEGAGEPYKDYIRKCLTFELQFESDVTLKNPGKGKGGWNSSMESKVKLQFDPAAWSVKGQAPLVNTEFKVDWPKCTATGNRGGGTFEISHLSFDTDIKDPEDELGYVKDIRMVYDPGSSTESFTLKCDKISQTLPPSPMWTGGYIITHQDEIQIPDGFIAENWKILGGEFYAEKEWAKDQSSAGTTESGTMKLYHKPE
jgi:hypothetical protein